MTHDDPYVDMVARYVKRFSGCGFAATLVLKSVLWIRIVDPTADDVRIAVDTASAGSKAAGLVFPGVRVAIDVQGLVKELLTDASWTRRDVPQKAGAFGLWRHCENGLSSCAMGLAPLGTMPVTRRAPYTSLILWTAGKSNPFAKRRKGQPESEIGLTDMPTGMDRAKYDATWQSVRGETKRIKSKLADDSFGPDVTFVL